MAAAGAASLFSPAPRPVSWRPGPGRPARSHYSSPAFNWRRRLTRRAAPLAQENNHSFRRACRERRAARLRARARERARGAPSRPEAARSGPARASIKWRPSRRIQRAVKTQRAAPGRSLARSYFMSQPRASIYMGAWRARAGVSRRRRATRSRLNWSQLVIVSPSTARVGRQTNWMGARGRLFSRMSRPATASCEPLG